MVLSAAATYGVAFEQPKSGRRFSSVHNARLRAGNGTHKLGGDGRNAGHALNEIESHALRCKHRSRSARNGSKDRAFVEASAIGDERRDLRGGID